MSQKSMDDVCATLKEGGCRSVHIGGGESFLDFDGLLALLKTCRRHGITVEYIETNAYWASNEEKVRSRLEALSSAGADTFCISVDPFHAEYVPYAAPLRLAKWCRNYGFGYFLWQERFLPMMKGLDAEKVHSRAAIEAGISKDYIWDTAQAYGLRMGGRAVNIAEEYSPRKPISEVANNTPCHRLLSTDHFHADMYGRFIPPGCTGIAIPLKEAIRGIPAGKYPAFEALLEGGVAALLEYAKGCVSPDRDVLSSDNAGFSQDRPAPAPCKTISAIDTGSYTSGCNLCFHLRHWLSKQGCCPELDPEHYDASLQYYST